MDIAKTEPITSAEPLICVHCSSRPATRFLSMGDEQDECCETCFEALFRECARCHRLVLVEDLVDVCTSRQTRWEPAEYSDWCRNCAEPREPDYDDRDE